MNPFNGIEIGCLLIVTKVTNHNESHITKNLVGKIFTVSDFQWGGRAHNRFVSAVIICNKAGEAYKAVTDQLASITPNYEPMGEIIVCTSCGVTIFETDLATKLDRKACPHCGVLDPAKS